MRSLAIINESDHVDHVRLAVGEQLEVTVEENATTGFEWHASAEPSSVLEIVENRFEAPQSRAAGAAGLRRVVVAAHRAGDAALTLELRRRWEREGRPARHVTVSMTVRGAQ